jgi:cytochrome P450
VSRLPATIPRAGDDQAFLADPLDFLGRTRARVGDLFVLRETGPLFSRAPDCAGVVVALGTDRQRAVLSDIETYGMPVSAAHQLTLPANLTNLNRGLHSMRGEEHASRKRLLAAILTPAEIGRQHAALRAALEDIVADWESGQAIGLLETMRKLVRQLSSHLLFGGRDKANEELSARLTDYFHLRREASSPAACAQAVAPADLLAAGNALDRSLRAYVRKTRRMSGRTQGGTLASLAGAEVAAGERMSEDEIVAHINVLHISSTEPVAVSLTWILLVLTQLPALQRQLREEIAETARAPREAVPAFDRTRLIDRVVSEVLRLFPPNAFMVRTTTRATSLKGIDLPAGCEVVLCPFLAHRDAAKFPDPGSFAPSRWKHASPAPFDYFPFGAGGHSCVGRAFALPLIKLVLSFLLEHFEFTLATDQAIDWRLHIMLMPRSDPAVIVRPPGGAQDRIGKLAGPVGRLLDFAETQA